jgi:hypothetical protein
MAFPVLIGGVPLPVVTSFVLTEGYKVAQIAGSSTLSQMTAPIAKTIKIEGLLINGFRSLRPAFEALALTNRLLAAAVGPVAQFAGIPVVARLGVHLDMQITSLVFTQDNVMRDAFKVTMELTNVPRGSISAIVGAVADVALGAASGFI